MRAFARKYYTFSYCLKHESINRYIYNIYKLMCLPTVVLVIGGGCCDGGVVSTG